MKKDFSQRRINSLDQTIETLKARALDMDLDANTRAAAQALLDACREVKRLVRTDAEKANRGLRAIQTAIRNVWGE